MDASASLIAQLADKARLAGRTLTTATSAERKSALIAIANEIESGTEKILQANAQDMARAKS